jgi:hypothetical protein
MALLGLAEGRDDTGLVDATSEAFNDRCGLLGVGGFLYWPSAWEVFSMRAGGGER